MTEINSSVRVRFGAYEADLHTHELWKHGTRIKLVGQPFEILAVLVKRPGQLVTREELRSQLWPGDTFVDFNHGLNAAVNKLRDALCDSADDPRYIETLPRRGYRFVATVENAPPAFETVRSPAPLELGQPATHAPLEFLAPPDAAAELAGETPVACPIFANVSPPLTRRTWLRYAAYAAGAAASLWLIAALLQFHGENREKQAKEAQAPGTLTPLTSLSDRTSNPAFSPDGSRVAFRRESFVPGTSGIWVKRIGGEELIQL